MSTLLQQQKSYSAHHENCFAPLMTIGVPVKTPFCVFITFKSIKVFEYRIESISCKFTFNVARRG